MQQEAVKAGRTTFARRGAHSHRGRRGRKELETHQEDEFGDSGAGLHANRAARRVQTDAAGSTGQR